MDWLSLILIPLAVIAAGVIAALIKLRSLAMSVEAVKAAQARIMAAVQRNATIDGSVRELLAGQAAQIKELKAQLDGALADDNTEGLQDVAASLGALAESLESENAATADAVKANTEFKGSDN